MPGGRLRYVTLNPRPWTLNPDSGRCRLSDGALIIVNSEEASASLRCIRFNDKELSDTTFVTSMTAVLDEEFWAKRLQHAQQLIESTSQTLEEVKGTLEELG